MDIKKAGFLCGIIVSLLPLSANATDILLSNKTNAYLTGGAGALCSSSMGIGYLNPNSDLDIKESDVKKLCPIGTCSVNIYMNKNCDGDSISTVKINKSKGVTDVKNHDNPNHYYAEGGGASLIIRGGAAKSWFNYFFS